MTLTMPSYLYDTWVKGSKLDWNKIARAATDRRIDRIAADRAVVDGREYWIRMTYGYRGSEAHYTLKPIRV